MKYSQGRTDVGASAMDSRELRQQAARCRRLAFAIGHADVSRTLHELADEYELRAKATEDDERNGAAGQAGCERT